MLLNDLSAIASRHFMTPQQIVADVAAITGIAMVVLGAFVRTMAPLRWLSVASNIGFLTYGVLHPSMITAVVAAALLPINLYRTVEMTRLTRRVKRAEVAADTANLWLRPYMKKRKMKEGEVVFHKGDDAHHLYLLASGKLEVVEARRYIEPGLIFGEMALFSPSQKRLYTIRCAADCMVLQIHASTAKQLYFQHPAFSFHLVQLMVKRMSENVERAETTASQFAQLHAEQAEQLFRLSSQMPLEPLSQSDGL